MNWKEVTGVILAAGRGSRIQDLGFEYPKPLAVGAATVTAVSA